MAIVVKKGWTKSFWEHVMLTETNSSKMENKGQKVNDLIIYSRWEGWHACSHPSHDPALPICADTNFKKNGLNAPSEYQHALQSQVLILAPAQVMIEIRFPIHTSILAVEMMKKLPPMITWTSRTHAAWSSSGSRVISSFVPYNMSNPLVQKGGSEC